MMNLTLDRVCHHYGSAQTLHEVSAILPSGGCLAVMGTNGAGKTTLLKSIMGLEPVTSGRILLNDENMEGVPSHKRVHRGVGYVPQGRDIFPDLSVQENLAIAADHLPVSEHKALYERVHDLFPVLYEMRGRRGGNLSGGQQQQLSIGRALMGAPSLLILDEPTEGIQPNVIQAIEDVITHLKGSMSILIVEQYFDFAKSVGDQYLILARGSVVDRGDTDNLAADEAKKLFAI
jgi:urea transport system ATP-binding protein